MLCLLVLPCIYTVVGYTVTYILYAFLLLSLGVVSSLPAASISSVWQTHTVCKTPHWHLTRELSLIARATKAVATASCHVYNTAALTLDTNDTIVSPKEYHCHVQVSQNVVTTTGPSVSTSGETM